MLFSDAQTADPTVKGATGSRTQTIVRLVSCYPNSVKLTAKNMFSHILTHHLAVQDNK